jgi:hypothetical protein
LPASSGDRRVEYGEKRKIVDNVLGITGRNANYLWKNEIEDEWKAR